MSDLNDVFQGALPAVVGADVCQATRLGHRVHRVAITTGEVVVKVFQSSERQAFRRELTGRRIAATALGHWAPVVITSGTTPSGHHYIVYDDVAGPSLHTLADKNRHQALRVLGSVLYRFHQITGPRFGPVTNPTVATAQDLLTSLAAHRADLLARHGRRRLAARLQELADQLTPQLSGRGDAVLCHNDLHFHNVIVATSSDRLTVRGVVDYESATFAVPEYDLAKTLVVCSAFTETDRQALHAGYGHPIDATILGGLTTYHAIDGWLWAALIEQRDHQLWQTRLRRSVDLDSFT